MCFCPIMSFDIRTIKYKSWLKFVSSLSSYHRLKTVLFAPDSQSPAWILARFKFGCNLHLTAPLKKWLASAILSVIIS